ncbi:hypothetical protein [Aestuariibius sp. HNIBRBA575]|uniref:hypothetical protein n=1 Tax=Aestuariibius sp. HNIBRBA575 TaxID=3233343 RepID=UPI0034A52284
MQYLKNTAAPRRQMGRVMAVTGCAIIGAGGAYPILAQDAQGPHSTFTYGLVFDADSNPSLDTSDASGASQFLGQLGYQYDQNLRNTQMSLGADTRFTTQDGALALDDPRLTLGFDTRASRHAVGLDLNYQRFDVSDLTLALDSTGTPVFSQTDGTRAVTNLGLDFEGGIDMPLRYQIAYDAKDIHHSTGASLLNDDSLEQDWNLSISADLTPAITTRLVLEHIDYNVDDSDDTQRITQAARLSTDFQLDQVTRLNLSFGQRSVETQTTSDTTQQDGSTWSIAAFREDRRGEYGIALDQTVKAGGTRQTLTLSRDADWSLGTIESSLGYVWREDDATSWIGTLDLRIDRPDAAVTLGLSRQANVANDGDVTERSQLRGQMIQQLNAQSQLNFGLSASHDAFEIDDQFSAQASATYQRQLNDDATLSVALERRFSRNTADETAHSNGITISFQRSLGRLH